MKLVFELAIVALLGASVAWFIKPAPLHMQLETSGPAYHPPQLKIWDSANHRWIIFDASRTFQPAVQK